MDDSNCWSFNWNLLPKKEQMIQPMPEITKERKFCCLSDDDLRDQVLWFMIDVLGIPSPKSVDVVLGIDAMRQVYNAGRCRGSYESS